MKKVGLVTIYDDMNFGNRLQNYALQYVLETNFNVKVVTLVADCQMQLVSMIKAYTLSILSKLPFGFKRSPMDYRWDAFMKFTRRYIKTKIFWGKDRIPESISDKYDVFITGSDQVWNYNLPVVRNHEDDYFLCFAESKKKNSYSASFGVDFLKEEWLENYQMRLRTFKNLSVREQAGQRIVSELIGKTASLNMDPTLLLTKEEWQAIEKRPNTYKKDQSYLLIYFLGDGISREDINSIALSRNLKVIDLLDDTADEYISGPSEFIYWIRNADLVCTDSFHATVFSIIFEKPFIVVSRQGMNSRIETLLKTFKLEDRYIRTERIEETDYNQICDYNYIHELIAHEKMSSMNYLKQLLII